VRRDIAQPLGQQLLVERRRALHDHAPVGERAGFFERGWLGPAVTRAERLPLERQQTMALQVAERAVVGEDVEAIARALRRATGLVAAVGARAGVGAKQRETIVG